MAFYPQSVLNQGTRPTPSPFVVLTFGLIVESIKESWGVSLKFLKLGLFAFWRAITYFVDL
jgi:hypothetical protein